MDLQEWSKSNAEYGRELLHSGIEGARSGGRTCLHGEPLAPFLRASVRRAWRPAAVGACLFVLGSCPTRRKSMTKTLAYGLLGAAIGMGASIAWENRRLTASAAGGALKNIDRVRDEHWLSTHPIDYA